MELSRLSSGFISCGGGVGVSLGNGGSAGAGDSAAGSEGSVVSSAKIPAGDRSGKRIVRLRAGMIWRRGGRFFFCMTGIIEPYSVLCQFGNGLFEDLEFQRAKL